MRAALLALACGIVLSACDFDGALGNWRCSHGACAGPTDAGGDGGADAGTDGGVDAGADGGSDGGSDAGADAGDGSYNLVFVTHQTFGPVTLGGPANGDTACAQAAASAQLPGHFVVWMGSNGADAVQRIILNGARGWVRPDGKPFLDQLGDTNPYVYYPPRLDELGDDLHDVPIISGARSNGSTTIRNCSNWTSQGSLFDGYTPGSSSGTGALWANSEEVDDGGSCSVPAHLLCFQTDHQRPLLPPDGGEGPFVFVSSPWSVDGGRPAADAWCNAEAARLDAGTGYLALLALPGQQAAGRLDGGRTWYRLDGTAVGDLSAAELDTAVAGQEDPVSDLVFTGAPSPQLAGTPESTCAGWTDSSGTGTMGDLAQSSFGWFGYTLDAGCVPTALYCAQP